jgi:ribosomal protein L37AE/L43A
MATQYEQPPPGPEGSLEPIERLEAITASDAARRLDRLAPLLHELIAWDLVRQTESGSFEIPEDVQERLRRLSSLQSGSVAQVYVGRKCGRCGSMRVTRMVDGLRLCSSCSSEVGAPAPSDDTPAATEPRNGHGRSRWHRKAG